MWWKKRNALLGKTKINFDMFRGGGGKSILYEGNSRDLGQPWYLYAF